MTFHLTRGNLKMGEPTMYDFTMGDNMLGDNNNVMGDIIFFLFVCSTLLLL